MLRKGGRLALTGIVIGGIAAAALSRLLARFAFQVSTLDVVTFTAVPVMLAAASLLAALVPANRATRADPMRALRAD